jgi:hypothetical protein
VHSYQSLDHFYHFVFASLFLHLFISLISLFKKRRLIRSPCCLCVPHYRPKSGIVEPEETTVAWQRLVEHVPAATNTHSTIEELLDAVLSMRFVYYMLNI